MNMDDEVFISVAEAKAKLSEKIHVGCELGRVFVITSHGRPRAVLLSYEHYMGLKHEPTLPRSISLAEWKKKGPKRREVAKSIKDLFDEKALSRKGQKGYKRHAVRQMAKS
jgi:prevent-host-death family protein